MRTLVLGSIGDFSITFSEDVIFPDDFYKKAEEDLVYLEQINSEQPSRSLRNSYRVFQFFLEGATSMKQFPITQDNVFIEALDAKQIKMKIVFENPEYISMNDQSF